MNGFLNLLVRSQRIDRRILYLILAVVLSLPFIITVPVPRAIVSPQTQRYYDTIEAMANDPAQRSKLVIISDNFGAGTAAENLTQTEATLRHLMKRHLKFALFNFTAPQGNELTMQKAQELAPHYGYVYGRDYVNWGFRPGASIVPLLKSAVRDVPGTFNNDSTGAHLTGLPVMQGIRTVDDIGLIVEVASSSTLNVWLQYYQRAGAGPIPTLYCPTAVMAPEAFPMLKSGQLQGMLTGLKGAIEYEGLLGEPGFATRASASLSYAHLLIILLIILGNVGMFAARRMERER